VREDGVTVSGAGGFGPWVPDIAPAERLARLRSLRALTLVLARPHAGELIDPKAIRPRCQQRSRCWTSCRH
jgi:hypothetical protein